VQRTRLAEEVAADGAVDLLLAPTVWEVHRAAADAGTGEEGGHLCDPPVPAAVRLPGVVPVGGSRRVRS
jgi:hypothetical protein